jgi:uncharacterized Tic20 family protein
MSIDPQEQQTRTWGMILHLSQLLNFVIPVGGVIVPIVIWQLKKNDLPGIDAHGKVVVNWILSALIYAVACLLLFVVGLGFVLLPVLGVLCIVFAVVGGIKANDGQVWK